MQNKKSIKGDNSKKQKLKTHSGITLIALIITIIVLLILAGVALNALFGDSGILNNAESAKEQTKKGNIKEQVELAVQSALINSLGKEIEEGNLQGELDEMFGEGAAHLNYNLSSKKYTVIIDEYEMTVTNTGEVEEVSKPDILIKFTLSYDNEELNAETLTNISDVTSENVPIPKGFYHVAGTTKDTGLVISSVDGDDINNTAGGNQFVWVPVNQKQKLTLDVTSNEEITGITLIGPDGTETAVTPSEKLAHNQEITMVYNGVYAVKVETASETKTAQKRVMSLYAQDYENDILMNINLLKMLAAGKYETAEDFKTAKGKTVDELAESNGVTVGIYMIQNYIYIEELEEELKSGFRTVKGLTDDMPMDNNQNTESVEQYGGFYIARYEAGDGTTGEARTDEESSDGNELVSQKGEYVYNWIDWETAKDLAGGMATNSYVTSQLITGAGWDRTINWLIETGMEEEKVVLNSNSWGNYNSGSSNMDYTTGRNEYWKANNIYDLAGNTDEWTQETEDTNSICRGGNYTWVPDEAPVAVRHDRDKTNQAEWTSFRTQLYINAEM